MRTLILTYCCLVPLLSSAATRDQQWQAVRQAMDHGLPKTAIQALQPILTETRTEGAHAEYAKAVAFQVMLETRIEGNLPEEAIRAMQRAIDDVPAQVRPVLETLLAHYYWSYLQRYRWQFLNRTSSDAPPGDDFTTWDLQTILKEIDRLFQAALSNPALLKSTRITEFDALLETGTLPDAYRPTLYDFIAHEAVRFYSAGEQAATAPEDQFDLLASTPIFDPPQEFSDFIPTTSHTNSPILRALAIFRNLLEFHQNDTDPSAFLDADLARLLYGWNVAVWPGKPARFQAALEAFVARAGTHPLAALALYRWASSVRTENDLVRAHALAQRGAEWETPGGQLCRNLMAEIEAPSLAVATEGVWGTDPVPVRLTYKNITQVHLRAVRYQWTTLLDDDRDPERLDDAQRRELLLQPPAASWAVDLEPTRDFQEHSHDLAPPRLDPGFYFILASPSPTFTDKSNVINSTAVWVSRLAIVTRPRADRLEGFVLDAESGEPIPGADVHAWRYQEKWLPATRRPVQTDRLGFFSFDNQDRQRYLIQAQHQDDRLALPSDVRTYRQREDQPEERTFFFTDRSLFRPGQTVHYKGICVRVNRAKNDYSIVTEKDLTVLFVDANTQEIARQTHRSNQQGSFSGAFTIPPGLLTGNVSLQVESNPQDTAWVSVEEYKRPRFEVILNPPSTPAALRQTVRLTGKAESYTGAPIDHAQFRYRVAREVRWPYWSRARRGGDQEIAHGSGHTEADGSFALAFPAQPAPDSDEQDEPTFHFSVSVDVTDASGETRSNQRSVVVGFTTFQANVSLDEWQTVTNPVAVRIETTTLDGEPVAATGEVQIYSLKEPDSVPRHEFLRPPADAEPNESADPDQWELNAIVAQKPFNTDGAGQTTLFIPLPQAGVFRVVLESRDPNGRAVTARSPLTVIDRDAQRFTPKLAQLVTAPQWTLEPGETFTSVWGTGYPTGRAFVEIEHRNQIVRRFWTDADRTQQQIQHAVTEAHRGGFTLHVTQVRHNRAYLQSRRIDVPWSTKKLKIRWEHFVSKLKPGAEETWTAIITGPKASPAVAEMVAALYDASLDAYRGHLWPHQLNLFYSDVSSASPRFANQAAFFRRFLGRWDRDYPSVSLSYRQFPPELNSLSQPERRRMLGRGGAAEDIVLGAKLEMPASAGVGIAADLNMGTAAGEFEPAAPAPNFDLVSARKNLRETAFFFPHLLSDKHGEVRLQFTIPEALTRWRLLAFAHDAQLRSGYLEDMAVTSKDIMIRPNPPRFLREGDTLEFTATVVNQSPTRQSGRVRLALSDAATGAPVDLNIPEPEQPFDIPANQSAAFSWKLHATDGLGILVYNAVAATDLISDGEEGYLPILPRRVLVTESLPLPINGPGTTEFTFTNLLHSAKSDTLRHQSLTLQMASQPAWYAVLALPYLMEFPYDCSEQTFNRYYANSLAQTLAASNPKIQRIFELWKNTDALTSPLEKNDDLKQLALEATPWVRQAQSESQARRRIGLLFDQNRLRDETSRALKQVTDQQREDGAWAWFPGGPANHYITLYITTGFGRLQHLGVDTSIDPALRALNYLDGWVTDRHQKIRQAGTEQDNHLSPSLALHLYARSFFLKEKPIADEHRPALDYFISQARRYWVQLSSRQAQAHVALTLHRFGPQVAGQTPQDIIRSLREHSVTDPELGMFWRDTEHSWHWAHAPIETQTLMVEAFEEIAADPKSVEACRTWLLKQKQTQDWKTTKATADAVYALLLRGHNLLASDEIVTVELGGSRANPERIEPGTGFYETRVEGPKVSANLARITVAKNDPGIAWGSVHWQYFQDVAELIPTGPSPLQVEKTMQVRTLTAQGPMLTPLAGPLAVGDELVVRIVVRVDRDMEFIHLMDQRGSGIEPLNVLSGHRWQDGLGYYESTRDTASHFFIAYLPKGIYVLEYPTRVVHRGRYWTGLTQIQSMYAPEFSSHAASQQLVVQ